MTRAWSLLLTTSIILACLGTPGIAMPLEEIDLHPDWSGADPVQWRLPLDTGEETALYLVGDALLIQYPDRRALVVNRDGGVERDFMPPYDLRLWYVGAGGDLLCEDGTVLALRELDPDPDYPDPAPTGYELLRMDIYGEILDRGTLGAESGPLALVGERNGLVLLTDGYGAHEEDGTAEAGRLWAWRDGEVLWQRPLPMYGLGVWAILDDGTVIYNDGDRLLGISPDGTELWSYEDEEYEVATIVSLDGRGALVAPGYNGDTIQRFDRTGLVWSLTGLNDIYLSDVPWRNCIYLKSREGFLVSTLDGVILIDQAGNKVWSRLTDYGADYISECIAGTFCFSDYELGFVGMDDAGNYLWTEPRLKSPEGDYLFDQDRIYSINGNELYCIDPALYLERDPVTADPAITYFAAEERDRIRWQVPADIYTYGKGFAEWMDPPKVDDEGYIYFQDHRGSGLQILTPSGEVYTSVYECGASYGEFTVRPGGGLFLVVDEVEWRSTDREVLMSDLGCADRDGNPLFKNDVMEFGRMSHLRTDGDLLYSLGESITCFDLAGNAIWTLDAGEDNFAVELCPLPEGGVAVRLENRAGDQAILIDATGKEFARFAINDNSRGPAVTADGALVFHLAGLRIYAVDYAGQPLWEHAYDATRFAVDYWNCGSPVASGDVVYAGMGDGRLIAFTSAGEVLWEYEAGSPVSTPALSADGTIYASALQQAVFALSPTGEELWRLGGLGFIYSPPVLGIDGTVLVLSENALLALEP